MLTIGPLQFDLPVVQAALAGYSDAPMRRIARRLGAPYALREVVLDKIVIQPGKRQRETLALSPDDHPIGGQLMGSQPEQIAAAAEIMVRSGFDVIDLNFACPVKKVLGRCRGGYLLSDPQTAIEVLRRVRDALPAAIPLTLKLRRGMDDSAESERNFFQILDAALELNIAAVTVHPRTVRQRYVGPSDWSFLARVKRYAGQRTIIGSVDRSLPRTSPPCSPKPASTVSASRAAASATRGYSTQRAPFCAAIPPRHRPASPSRDASSANTTPWPPPNTASGVPRP